VPPDVLPQAEQLAVRGEQAGRVQPAGAPEADLAGREPVGQRGQRCGRHHGRIGRHVELRTRPYRVDAGFAADAARRRRVEIAGRIRGWRRYVRRQRDVDNVVGVRRPVTGAQLSRTHIRGAADDPLRQQEAHREVKVIPRGTHGDCERPAPRRTGRADPDLQRLLRRHLIGLPPDRGDRTGGIDPDHHVPDVAAGHSPILRAPATIPLG
jgi:hypothetical protein